MKTVCFLVFTQGGHVRITRRGPPQTKSGERFVKLHLEASDDLWAPQRVETLSVRATAQNTASAPAKVNIGDIEGICPGVLVMRQKSTDGGYPQADFRCTSCDFSTYSGKQDVPHWIYREKDVPERLA